MNNILGPYTQDQFNTLKLLKHSIAYMEKTNAIKYRRAIKKETELFKHIVSAA